MYPAVVFCTEATERLLILKWEIDKFDILHDEHNKLEFPLTTKKNKTQGSSVSFLGSTSFEPHERMWKSSHGRR
jgi:hypothetical protein